MVNSAERLPSSNTFIHRQNMLEKENIIRLDTIVEENVTDENFDEEIVETSGSIVAEKSGCITAKTSGCIVAETSGSTVAEKSGCMVVANTDLFESPRDPMQHGTMSANDSCNPEMCRPSNDPDLEQGGQEDLQEEPPTSEFDLENFAYNLLLGFLPTVWDVVSDLRTAKTLEESEECSLAGLSFLFVCLPGYYLLMDLLQQKISNWLGSKAIIVNIVCTFCILLATIFWFSTDELAFKYPAFVIGLGMICVKGVGLFVQNSSMKELAAKVTKLETEVNFSLRACRF